MATPFNQIVSSDTTIFETQEDFDMVHRLLRNSLYKIPEAYRTAVLNSAARVLNDENAPAIIQLAASRVILECDKRNLDMVKIAMPKKVISRSVTELTTDELQHMILEAAERIKLPELEVLDGHDS